MTGVAALLTGSSLAGMDTMALLWKAVSCVGWQAGLTATSCLAVNTVVAVRFDGKGNERKNKKRRR